MFAVPQEGWLRPLDANAVLRVKGRNLYLASGSRWLEPAVNDIEIFEAVELKEFENSSALTLRHPLRICFWTALDVLEA